MNLNQPQGAALGGASLQTSCPRPNAQYSEASWQAPQIAGWAQSSVACPVQGLDWPGKRQQQQHHHVHCLAAAVVVVEERVLESELSAVDEIPAAVLPQRRHAAGTRRPAGPCASSALAPLGVRVHRPHA